MPGIWRHATAELAIMPVPVRSPAPKNARLWLVVALAAAVPVVTACNESGGDETAGKELFTQRCGACHVLNDAGTKGVQGPNLDFAFDQSIKDGLGRSTIEGVVREQIATPMGKQMPANIVTGKDADSVAAYVASAVGKPPAAGGAAGGTASGTAKANAQNVVDVPTDPTGQLAYKFKAASAKAGKVTLESTNDSSVPHNIALKDGPEGEVVQGGKTSKIEVDLKSGSYTFYCSVPGHEQAGMKGTLSVK
jgi:mono/diheme cytochrome c family protein